MMLASNASRFFVVVLAAACNAVTSATPDVNLGTAENYAILTKAGISTLPSSVITGDIAVSPIAGTAITGFSLSADQTNKFSTSDQLTGKAFAANYMVPTPADLSTAVSDMEIAYTDARSRLNTDADKLNLGSGLLGRVGYGDATKPLTPGVYTFETDVTIASDIVFEGTNADDIFIIQTTGNLVQVAGKQVTLKGSALAKNIFWQVAGHVVVGAGAHLEGILLVQTDVLFETGSSLDGRVLAQTACVLQQATITEPAN
jgi:hypothetical protein